MYCRQPGAGAVQWIYVAHCGPAELGPDLTREAAMARLHLRRADGNLVSGTLAFTGPWQLLPQWARLGRVFGNRPGLWLLEAGYRVFLVARRGWRQT